MNLNLGVHIVIIIIDYVCKRNCYLKLSNTEYQIINTENNTGNIIPSVPIPVFPMNIIINFIQLFLDSPSGILREKIGKLHSTYKKLCSIARHYESTVKMAFFICCKNTVFLSAPVQFSVVRIVILLIIIQFSNTVQNTSYFAMYMYFSTDFAGFCKILLIARSCMIFGQFHEIAKFQKACLDYGEMGSMSL